MPAFGDDPGLAAGDVAARDIRCALLHWNWSAETLLRAELPWLAAAFAQPGSSDSIPRRTQTVEYGGARPAPAAARPGSPSGSRPPDRGNTRGGCFTGVDLLPRVGCAGDRNDGS